MRPRALLVSALLSAAALLQAALPVSEWRVLPTFSRPAMQVVETGDKVYYLAGGGLFSYDKSNQETYAYTAGNSLSDYIVSAIYPHPEDEFVVVCYSNGNIDLLMPDGSVTNLSDIKDSNSSLSKTINDVAVSGNDIFVATGFGVVIFNVSSRKVTDSGIYNTPVTAIAASGSKIFISVGEQLLTIDRGNRINRLENWNVAGSPGTFLEFAIDENDNLIARDAYKARLITFADGAVASAKDIGECNQHFVLSGRRVFYSNGTDVVENHNFIYLPEQTNGFILGGMDPASNAWLLTDKGISSWVRNGGSWSCTSESFRPDASSVMEASFIIPSADGERIYFTNLGPTNYRVSYSTESDGTNYPQATTRLSGEVLADVAAKGVTAGSPAADFYPARSGLAGATTRLAESPVDMNTYYLGTGNDGLYRVTDGIYSGRYDASNSPMGTPWGSRVYEVSFDRSGNMWVGADGVTASQCVMVLPAAKLAADPSAVSRNDWILPNLDGFVNEKDIRIFHCRKSDMAFIFSYNTKHRFVAYHTNGTPDNFNDDRSMLWTELTDTDGKIFVPRYITSIAEDADGKIWMGTTDGIFEISHPEDAINPSMIVRRLKIDHNDGTGLADYFAETDIVLDISVDGANRKWVATRDGGVYLVNPYGNEIIRHFTPDNSPLPSRKVNAVYADQLSNSVYFSTPGGIMEYGSDATKPADSFSDIKIYPNPVTPEYGGDVTIEGLMDGSLVKIADSAGAVVWQGRAEGGMITWNTENSAGRRVRTGVYYVFVSSNASESAKGATAKLMIVR